MESVHQMIKQLTGEVINLKKINGDGKKITKPFLNKKTNTNTSHQVPPTLGINLEDYAMENYCLTHHANHSERTGHEFINSFTAMLLPLDPPKMENKNEK